MRRPLHSSVLATPLGRIQETEEGQGDPNAFTAAERLQAQALLRTKPAAILAFLVEAGLVPHTEAQAPVDSTARVGHVRARALDNEKKEENSGGLGGDALEEAVADLVPAMANHLRAFPDLHLLRVSLTVPRGTPRLRESMKLLAAEYVVDGEGALLAVDVSGREKEHVYGIVAAGAQRSDEVAGLWRALTGADTNAIDVTRVRGWRSLETSDNGLFDQNLAKVLRYQFDHHSWPKAMGLRDADLDVVASGALVDPWRRVRGLLGGMAANLPGDGSSPSAEASRCKHCDGLISRRKRKDAQFCCDSCRKRAFRVSRSGEGHETS